MKIEKKWRENWKWKVERLQNEESTFFFLLLLLPFFASHFSKPLKFVLGLPKWKFSTGKRHFTPGKKSGKLLCPLRKVFLLRPWKWFLPQEQSLKNPSSYPSYISVMISSISLSFPGSGAPRSPTLSMPGMSYPIHYRCLCNISYD